MARTYRDAYGVPHVRGDDVLDLAHGQGEATGRDRTWQLELQRRRATGTLAEAMGPDAVPWDRFARRARIAHHARRAHAGLDQETAAFVAAYVAGVNAGLRADVPELLALRHAPVDWEPWTPLAVFLGQHVLFGSFPGKLWEHRAREVLGDGVSLLAHEGPSSGSNAWAVAGTRTASGSPLVAGDPHRAFESPNVYQQVRLAAPGIDVAGFAFPGVPGVQHFAHAGDVAWAITNAAADYQDVYAERLRRRGGVVEAHGPDGWEAVEAHVERIDVRAAEAVEVEVVTTPRGDVVHGGPHGGEGIALRTASGVLGDLGFSALLPLLRAGSVDDVERALDRWVEPVNNVVVADRSGAVRYRVAGRVPLRQEANRHGIVSAEDLAAAWTGWVDPLPREEAEVLVTANERRGPGSDPIGTAFAPPHRADRIGELLGGRTDLTADDCAAIQADTRAPYLPVVRTLLESLPPHPLRDVLVAWDGHMDAGSTGAAAYAGWRAALVARLAAEPVFEALATPVVDDPVLLPALDLRARVAAGLESLLAAGTPFGIDVRAHAAAALDEAEADGTWGDRHTLTPLHAFDLYGGLPAPAVPPVGVRGDADCVCCTGGPGSDDAWRGSVARYVWDLADPAGGGWVVPLGASADPHSPHHLDQLEPWLEVRLVPLVRDWDRLSPD